jgi:hypothetical protein
MQLLPESGNVRSPLLDSGERVWPDPAKIARLLRIRSDPAGSQPFWLDPAEFWPFLASSDRLLTMAGIWSTGIQRQWPDVAGFQWPDVAGF